jgi:hypothetical protein
MSDSIEKSTIVWMGGIVIGAMTMTATGVHVLHEQFISPIRTFEADQKIEKLEKQLKSQTSSLQELEKVKQHLKNANNKILLIEQKDLFLPGDIYPSTLNDVKLGQPISLVYEAYDKKSISTVESETSENKSLKVSLENSVFDNVQYGYDEKNIITTITYTINYRKHIDRDFLKTALTRALGPSQKSKTNKKQLWTIEGSGTAFLFAGSHYVIMREDYVPLLWEPQEE